MTSSFIEETLKHREAKGYLSLDKPIYIYKWVKKMKITGFILKGLCIFIFVASNCYAIELHVDALKDPNSMVPKSYAKVVKDKEVEKVVFTNSSTFYCPECLNHIFAAYE